VEGLGAAGPGAGIGHIAKAFRVSTHKLLIRTLRNVS